MFVDTHCHINMMIKKTFDVPLSDDYIPLAQAILDEAQQQKISTIINVGTSVVESANCVTLATSFPEMWATIGTHPNDLTNDWKDDIDAYERMLTGPHKERIVGIGEIGLDYHYPDFNKQQQYDAFKAQIELALEYSRAIVVHTRDAHDETLRIIEPYKRDGLTGIIHCFSEDQAFAHYAQELGFYLGIGGTLTYPKNNELRAIFANVPLANIVLETDAPFLPPQYMRGKQNNPAQIAHIATFLAELKKVTVQEVATVTSRNALKLFKISQS